MKAFLTACLVVAVSAVAADYLLGGPLTESGGVIVKQSASAVYASPNVRLGDQ